MNSNEEKVSVIIPIYNSARFLKESIESVLNQTYKNIEIIAVDDGSTDNSFEILSKYSEKIIILKQENQGLAAALNNGIKKMHGKWFKWFSPDDILFPDAIEILLQEIKQQPENTIIYSNWELIDEDGKKLREFSESNYNNLSKFDFNVRLLDGQQINVNSTLIPTSLFSLGCTIQNLEEPTAIDYEFFLKAALIHNTKFHLIPKTLIKYRIHKNQLSHKNISKTLLYISNLKNELLSHLDEQTRMNYMKALEEYQKKKSLKQKTLESGLRFAKDKFPEWISDKLILFYLNKIRRSR